MSKANFCVSLLKRITEIMCAKYCKSMFMFVKVVEGKLEVLFQVCAFDVVSCGVVDDDDGNDYEC